MTNKKIKLICLTLMVVLLFITFQVYIQSSSNMACNDLQQKINALKTIRNNLISKINRVKQICSAVSYSNCNAILTNLYRH